MFWGSWYNFITAGNLFPSIHHIMKGGNSFLFFEQMYKVVAQCGTFVFTLN